MNDKYKQFSQTQILAISRCRYASFNQAPLRGLNMLVPEAENVSSTLTYKQTIYLIPTAGEKLAGLV